jgi:hypothetical protein
VSDSPAELLDDFRDTSGWSSFTSGQVQLALSSHDSALRLDFDFRGGGGFAVARKPLARALPSRWALRFRIRGDAPRNRFELKLVDPSGRNVWWHHRDAFEFPSDWCELRVRSSDVEFAWGPAGGGEIAQLGAIELAIVAGTGGRGSVWIADLLLEDLEYRARPRVWASSAAPGSGPELALDGSRGTSWRATSSGPEFLAIDFGEVRELGGLRIDWDGAARAFELQTSADGSGWTSIYSTTRAQGACSHLYLPGQASRYLRLELREAAGSEGLGIRELVVQPSEVARSLTRFFESVAKGSRRGLFPRYLYGEQTHWTALGSGDGHGPALLSEDGVLEVERAGFSIEPFLFVDGELVSWADAQVTQQLAERFLPIPSSLWRAKDLLLEVTACSPGADVLLTYRLRNTGHDSHRVRCFAAVRPFQVTPPWQAFQGLGGTSPVRELELRDGVLWVNAHERIRPLTPPDGFGAAALEQGGIGDFLLRGQLPPRTWLRDRLACASGALCWDLELAPGAEHEIALRVRSGAVAAELEPRSGLSPAAQLDACRASWREKLGRVGIRLGEPWQECVDVLRSATAQILVNRVGAALHPGPRRYARAWIRDGASMAAALLRTGFSHEVRAFLEWYAPYQAADGNVPCCVDRAGPDWLPEHDSHGQFIFAVAQYFRASRDRAFLTAIWPRVLRAVDYLETLRSRRLTPEYAADEKRACRGLLPESVSHEGYMAQPVHSYWDDFWALRGLEDAADLAQVVADGSESRLRALRDSLRESLYASIETTIARRGLDYVPASVEWADLDPTATAMALIATDAAQRLPRAALARTWELYLDGFRRRRSGAMEWASYAPYEIRCIGALVRLGRREEAHELLDYFLADRRPRAWNQWPEIVWRDPRTPGHLGDLPHSWVAAEYVLALLDLFALESPADGALVLAAGIPERWLAGGQEVRIENLPTSFGPLSYGLRRDADGALALSLAGDLRLPRGGIIVRPPLPRALREVRVDGAIHPRFDSESVTLDRCRAEVRMR